MKILFTGGGTGGHIFPIVSVARELKKYYSKEDLYLFFAGPREEIPLTDLTREGIKVKRIIAGKIRRYFTIGSLFQNLFDIFFKIPIGIIQAFFYVFFLAPDLIFSKGGYGSFSTVLAGKFLGTPVFLHESDTIPGLTNRFTAKFALEIFVSFPTLKTEYFPQERMLFVGNPIRQTLLQGNEEEARAFFKIDSQKPLILILGGSQGAQRINDVIYKVLNELLVNFEIIHQVGPKNFSEGRALAEVLINKDSEKYYHLYPFLNEQELGLAMVLSNLIISRAGSGSIFEIAAAGKPSILIPLPEAAQNHQLENTYLFAENGASLVIEEANLTPHFLLDRIKYLFSHPTQLKEMEREAKAFSKPKASDVIAGYIIEYLSR